MKNSTAQRNPYIIGRPIHEPEKLFGRESVFLSIEEKLKQRQKVILLHGQRRMGISSVLNEIPVKITDDNFVFVPFDLQHHSQSSLSEILHNLAETITFNLDLDSDRVIIPTDEELTTNPDIFSQEFLLKVYHEINNKNLVLLLDEFDVVSADNNDIVNQGAGFFLYLQSLLRQHEKLFIIPTLGRHPDDLANLLSLFQDAPCIEIGLLDERSTQRLITKPAEGILEYEADAIKEIWQLSAGHPYFTQVICFTLFVQAKTEDNWKVTRTDVQTIIDKAIDSAEGGLTWFWYGLPRAERVVFSAVAEAQKIAIEQNKTLPEAPLTLLTNYGVILTEPLIAAPQQLATKGLLDDSQAQVKIEFIRRWLVQRHPISQAIWALEKFAESEVNQLIEEATRLQQEGKNQDAITVYEQVLAINPNHFSTLLTIATTYLEVKNFERSIECYRRASQVDPTRNKEKLLVVLETHGNHLRSQGELSRAKEQFNRVLELEPDRSSAQQKIREIEAETADLSRGSLMIIQDNNSRNINYCRTNKLLITTVFVLALTGLIGSITSVTYNISTPCSAGQQKVYNFFCQADPNNISRGDRTFFVTIPNPNRSQGIEEFKKGNYAQAAKLFQKAVKAGRNDPEVLIYYNNARARQQGQPLTLAAVIPADNEQPIAQEMLRGVAQAQNDFNNNKGLNSRLLEIAIANDANNPDQAKQIAQQLVQDSSILGVIGHNTSDTTFAALEEYKKAGLAIVSPSSTSISLKSNVLFRAVPSDASAGKTLAEYAEKSGINRVVIFYNPQSTYSKSLTEEFTQNFGGLSKRIDLTQPNLNLEQVFQESAEEVQAAVLFPNADKKYLDKALEIAQANSKLGVKGLKLLGGNALTDGDQKIEGLTLAVPWFREAPQSKTFAQVALKQWGGNVSWRTATSYDATQALIKALSPDASRSTVLQKLPQINLSPTETSGDKLRFQNGERQSQPILIKVENGQFKVLQYRF
ncbi:MAG: ABC transporter substrate-binding protein [Gloeotrichia echinulata GP01]